MFAPALPTCCKPSKNATKACAGAACANLFQDYDVDESGTLSTSGAIMPLSDRQQPGPRVAFGLTYPLAVLSRGR